MMLHERLVQLKISASTHCALQNIFLSFSERLSCGSGYTLVKRNIASIYIRTYMPHHCSLCGSLWMGTKRLKAATNRCWVKFNFIHHCYDGGADVGGVGLFFSIGVVFSFYTLIWSAYSSLFFHHFFICPVY